MIFSISQVDIVLYRYKRHRGRILSAVMQSSCSSDLSAALLHAKMCLSRQSRQQCADVKLMRKMQVRIAEGILFPLIKKNANVFCEPGPRKQYFQNWRLCQGGKWWKWLQKLVEVGNITVTCLLHKMIYLMKHCYCQPCLEEETKKISDESKSGHLSKVQRVAVGTATGNLKVHLSKYHNVNIDCDRTVDNFSWAYWHSQRCRQFSCRHAHDSR